MEVINPSGLTQKEQDQLIKKVKPFVKGFTHKSNIKVPIGKKTVNCNYQQSGNCISVNSVSEGKKSEGKTNPPADPPKTTEIPQLSKLDKLIKSGEVTKNNNWYTYKGKNYNGKLKILAAIGE